MRQDDHETKHFFRSSGRAFRLNGAWYFSTREGDNGPYPSEDHVSAEIGRFILEKTELAHFQSVRENEQAKNTSSTPFKLEVIMPEDSPIMSPAEPLFSKHKVYI